MKCCGISRAVFTLPVISACVWKNLGGACWISAEIHRVRVSWSVREREKIRKGPFVVRDRELPFAEDLITDEAGVVDPQLPVLTKVLWLVDVMRLGGIYELIEKLWAQFLLTAGSVNTEVPWTCDVVLVGSVDFRKPFVSFLFHIVVLLLVNRPNRIVARNSITRCWLGEGSPFLQP